MISYKQWKALHESLGTFNLGVRSPQAIGGIYSRYHAAGKPVDERSFGGEDMGATPPMGQDAGQGGPPMPPMPKKKKRHDDDEFEDDDLEGDEFEDEEGDDEFEDEDDELEDDDEEGDEFEDEEGGGEEDPHKPMGKFPVKGEPHDQRPFMKLSRESCSCDDEDEGDDKLILDDDDDEDKGDKKGKKGDDKEVPAFMMKKKIKKGMKSDKVKEKKKCSGVMCKKCKKMKAETHNYDYYRRPQAQNDSQASFLKSIAGHSGNVHQKWDDGLSGMREDLLIPPGEVTPGGVGYAPQTRLSGPLGQDTSTTESVQHLMRRLLEIEKKMKD